MSNVARTLELAKAAGWEIHDGASKHVIVNGKVRPVVEDPEKQFAPPPFAPWSDETDCFALARALTAVGAYEAYRVESWGLTISAEIRPLGESLITFDRWPVYKEADTPAEALFLALCAAVGVE